MPSRRYHSIHSSSELPEDQYMPVYLHNPLYGSAWMSRTCIVGPTGKRFFIKIRYKLPGDSSSRYQVFYQNATTDARFDGTWFPVDGIVATLDLDTGRIHRNRIARVTHTKSALGVRRKPDFHPPSSLFTPFQRKKSGEIRNIRTIASWFGSPIFVFISIHLQKINLLKGENLWENPLNCTKIMYYLGSPVACPESVVLPEYSLLFFRFPVRRADEMINRFIETAISRNWLRDLPHEISAHRNEYESSVFTLDLNDIVGGRSLDLPSVATPKRRLRYEGHIQLPNGMVMIPEVVLVLDPSYWSETIEKMKKKIFSNLNAPWIVKLESIHQDQKTSPRDLGMFSPDRQLAIKNPHTSRQPAGSSSRRESTRTS